MYRKIAENLKLLYIIQACDRFFAAKILHSENYYYIYKRIVKETLECLIYAKVLDNFNNNYVTIH